MKLILASSSKTRATLLANAGIEAIVSPVAVDEDSIRASLLADGCKPHDMADTLAEFKARRGADRVANGGEPVLGCDQILEQGGEVFAKPDTRDAAAEHLMRLQGKTHRLLSAAVIYENTEPVWRVTGQARLTMHSLSTADIDAYLDLAWPDVASSVGAYHAEGLGARLFSRIDGDWFSVLGLPLLQLLSYLRQRGWLR